MAIKTSQVQANYAQTILRVARSADKAVAIRLIEGLANDAPTPDATEEQAGLHRAAIRDYLILLTVLREGKAAPPWTAAFAATERWRSRT